VQFLIKIKCQSYVLGKRLVRDGSDLVKVFRRIRATGRCSFDTKTERCSYLDA